MLETLSGCTEKLSYGAPFYFRHARICYIWPGSITWGKSTSDGVIIGFCKGHELQDASWLEKGARKEIFIKRFKNRKEIDAAMLKALLFESLEIDTASYLNRKSGKKRIR